MRITEYKNYEFLLGAAAGGAAILLISMYELAGLWGAIAALSAILIFLGLRALRPRQSPDKRQMEIPRRRKAALRAWHLID